MRLEKPIPLPKIFGVCRIMTSSNNSSSKKCVKILAPPSTKTDVIFFSAKTLRIFPISSNFCLDESILKIFIPVSAILFTFFSSTESEMNSHVFSGSTGFNIFDFIGMLRLPSIITLTGFRPLTSRTFSRGLSVLIVPAPTKTASYCFEVYEQI